MLRTLLLLHPPKSWIFFLDGILHCCKTVLCTFFYLCFWATRNTRASLANHPSSAGHFWDTPAIPKPQGCLITLSLLSGGGRDGGEAIEPTGKRKEFWLRQKDRGGEGQGRWRTGQQPWALTPPSNPLRWLESAVEGVTIAQARTQPLRRLCQPHSSLDQQLGGLVLRFKFSGFGQVTSHQKSQNEVVTINHRVNEVFFLKPVEKARTGSRCNAVDRF